MNYLTDRSCYNLLQNYQSDGQKDDRKSKENMPTLSYTEKRMTGKVRKMWSSLSQRKKGDKKKSAQREKRMMEM